MKKVAFSGPTVINLELTDACNVKCRHCYNFWRDDNDRKFSMDFALFDRMVERFVEAGIFHVVLTGGEPFSNFKVLEYALRKLTEHGISLSCNSNLMMATDDNIRRLADTGLDHILTSLTSHDPATNDYLLNQAGAFSKIIRGIETTVRGGIRVSVNMVVSQINKAQVYDTGLLVHRLGCQKFFGTRTVPMSYEKDIKNSDYQLSQEDSLDILDQMVRVKEETGIMIGTLVSYPLCLLGDLEKYRDFVGRGCPAQRGHVMSLNANGAASACTHQAENYGNILEEDIKTVYARMHAWHDGSYHHSACEGCDYLDICESGCRMSAERYNNEIDAADQLMIGKHNFVKPYRIVHDPAIYQYIDARGKFMVPKRLRFRKENGFYMLNIRWANTVTIDTATAEFLMSWQKRGTPFTVDDLGIIRRHLLAELYFKDAVESRELIFNDRRDKAGLSTNLATTASVG
jgi:radical SAM protein with 4Fe4S-binding SPASM domain